MKPLKWKCPVEGCEETVETPLTDHNDVLWLVEAGEPMCPLHDREMEVVDD